VKDEAKLYLGYSLSTTIAIGILIAVHFGMRGSETVLRTLFPYWVGVLHMGAIVFVDIKWG
jgi:hypothetical protein